MHSHSWIFLMETLKPSALTVQRSSWLQSLAFRARSLTRLLGVILLLQQPRAQRHCFHSANLHLHWCHRQLRGPSKTPGIYFGNILWAASPSKGAGNVVPEGSLMGLETCSRPPSGWLHRGSSLLQGGGERQRPERVSLLRAALTLHQLRALSL